MPFRFHSLTTSASTASTEFYDLKCQFSEWRKAKGHNSNMQQSKNCQRRKAQRREFQVIVFLQELVAVIDSREKVSGNMGMSGVRTLRRHVRVHVFLLLLSCTTSFLTLDLVISVFLVNTDFRRCVKSPMWRSRWCTGSSAYYFCEHWLEALRPVSHSKIQVMHRIVPRAALCSWYCACSLASCGTTGFVRPVWMDPGFSSSSSSFPVWYK